MNLFRKVIPNLFRHLFVDETLKQVQGDKALTVYR